MARLSGLPSEHHHEGPGDAPRRKRGRPNKNQSASQEASSSGKRTASPTGELSETKRTKRTQGADEDQITEELEQSISRSQQGDDTIRVDTQSTTTTTRRHNRRHSEPLAAVEELDELTQSPLPSTQPAPGLTPHLNRIGAIRTQAVNARRGRMSMPAQLHVERIDDAIGDTQFQYAPLTAVLDSRTRRRLRRSHLSQEMIDIEDHQKKDKSMLLELRRQLRTQDAKIKELEYQLEARRLGEIDITDDHAEELEQELEQARQQIDALRSSDLYHGNDQDMSVFDGTADSLDDEDEQLLLVDPNELSLSRDIDYIAAPNGRYATRIQELSSQMTFESLPELSQLTHDTLMEDDNTIIADKIEDQAVERYERELQHYIRILAESQGALRVLTLELQNLRFLDPGFSSNDILKELRHGFDTLRLEIEKFFPNTTTHLTNQELLQKIPQLFGGIFFELREKITLLSVSQKTEVLLRRQYEGVLDLLAESEDRIKDLQKNEYSLDKSNEDKQRTIVDLEERIISMTTFTGEQEAELKEKDAQINGLQDDIEDKDTALERLREAIETYRKDLDTVTQTATTFEEEHHETIARMEQEHADTVRDLSEQLATEQEGRENAEADAQAKGEVIDELEGRIERMEHEVDVITDEMDQLRQRLAEQTEGREEAEGQRDQQAELVYEYSSTIENLNETIADLKSQVEEYRTNLDTERSQREQTEAALDEANEKLDDLNERMHNAGVQANELRSKLFQLQQEKEAALAQLQEDAQEREDDLNDQLAAETQLRETAEATVAKLNEEIDQLQGNLSALDIDLTNMSDAREQLEQDRERQAAALNNSLSDLQSKYIALENSTSSTITSLKANIQDLNNQVQRQQTEIKRLAEQVAEQDRVYADETTLLKEEIAELRSDLEDERVDNDNNQKEISSLSQRVENEANELLNIVNSHSEEVSALKSVISTQEARIQELQNDADDRAAEYEETIAERTAVIEELRALGDARLETIVILETSVTKLKEKFAAQEEDTRVTIDALNLAHRRLLDENEQLAAALKKRNADTLKAVQEMKTERIVVKTQGVDLDRVQTGKIIKASEKVKVAKKGGRKKVSSRSWRDSGFGAEDDASSSKIADEDALAA